ncbi:MAG: hypothetical protein U0930_24450 [Pirellulales bacterium]
MPVETLKIFRASIRLAICLVAGLGSSTYAVALDDPPTRSSEGDTQAQVLQLIEQLGDANFRVRAKAQQALEKIGLPAYEELRKAQDHTNIQIARSAEYLLRSQNVVWWLDTDSYEVKSRLQDYSSLDTNNRQTRLLELANLGTDDSLLALARIAKFESNETCSREAAIGLLGKLSSIEPERKSRLSRSVLLMLGTPNRSATEWLETFCSQVFGSKEFQLDVWRDYAEKLGQDLKRSAAKNYVIKGPREQLFKQQRQQVLKFYEWVVGWIRREQDRETALQVAKQSIDLASENLHAAHEYCTWALSVDLPELVVALISRIQTNADNAGAQPGIKALLGPVDRDRHRMMYLLAEAYRKMGDEKLAEQAATEAREAPDKQSAAMVQLARGNLFEIIVIQRTSQAKLLKDRGLFDWAEAEYLAAIAVGSKSELDVRLELAEMYREGKQFTQAAAVMEKIAQMPPPADRNLPLADNFQEKQAYFHWYKALVANESGNTSLAIEQLLTACEFNDQCDEPNPDIVITLHRMKLSDEAKAKVNANVKRLIEKYRFEISQAESTLIQQATGTQQVAQLCNQLAWLLASCEINVEEAQYLSRRSLEFDPDEPSFLDTMARCQLAAHKYEEALKYQKRAVAASPHSRSMKSQLAEIEKALQDSIEKKNGNGKQ